MRPADHVSKRGTHPLQCVWLELDGANELGSIFAHARAVEGFHFLYDVGPVKFPAIGDRRHHVSKLQRRHSDIALTNGDGDGLAWKPGLAVSFSLPFGTGNRAASFIIQGDTRLFSQSECIRPFCNSINTELGTELVEIGIARLDDRFVQIHCAMTALFPVPKAAVAERIKAGILNETLRLNDAFFETGDRHHDLERRSRWVLALNRPIAQWPQLIFDQAVPFIRLDAARKSVGVEGRRARQREDRTVMDVQSHDRALFAFQRFERGFLKLAVQGQMNRVSWDVGDLVQYSDTASKRIDFHLLSTALAAQ